MKKIYSLILFITLTLSSQAQMLSVNTDAAMLALMLPNVGAELTVGDRSTFGLNLLTAQNPWGLTTEAYCLQPEYRYYFSSRPMNRVFVGLGGLAATYNADFKGKEYDGYALGAGLVFGYTMPLSERWNVDFHAGYGAIYYKHKENDIDAQGTYMLPTRIGVSLSYIIK